MLNEKTNIKASSESEKIILKNTLQALQNEVSAQKSRQIILLEHRRLFICLGCNFEIKSQAWHGTKSIK